MKKILLLLTAVFCLLSAHATYYLAGSMNQWQTNNSQYQFSNNSLQITLSAGNYLCKVTQGSWNVPSFSAADLARPCTHDQVLGLPNDHDNICFSLRTTTTITFTITAEEQLCVTGDFGTNTWEDAINYQTQQPGSAPQYSNTLPVLYINTEGGAAITSKDDYVSATGYIDNLGLAGYDALGSDTARLNLSIKGRGNWTWRGFAKKPYNIKFDSKQSVLGMPKHKHWSLMAGADDNLGFLRNPVGYHISKALGMKWTSSYCPIELILNDEYMGLYFLTQSIKVDKNRINITSQEDETMNADSITGGWVVEIDNYQEEGQVYVTEGNGAQIMFSMKVPEVLSAPQRSYITNQLEALNNAIYEPTSTHWEELLDLDEAVRFYLIQEITDNTESYHGSCYLHKDNDASGDSKWYFGPVWDFGNCFFHKANDFIYNAYPYAPMVWVGQLNTFPAFHNRLMEVWHEFYTNIYPHLYEDIQAIGNEYAQAAIADANRWEGAEVPHGGSATQTERNISNAVDRYWENINWRIQWLYSQWHDGTTNQADIESSTTPTKQFIDGSIYIIHGQHRYTTMGVMIK